MPTKRTPKSAPLKVAVTKGQLVISIGVDTLAHALKHKPEEPLNVTHPTAFAEEVVLALTYENETGENMITKVLEEAAQEAYMQGSQYATD